MFLKKVYCLLTLGVIFSSGQFIYLNTGVFKFIAGIGLPVDVNMGGSSLTWFTNLQVFYKLPDNITQYEPYKIMQKRSVKNTLNRYTLYQAFNKYSERLGFQGNQCIHRLICEVAKRNIDREDNGLFGKLIHILFSPGKDPQLGLEEHKKAQRHGLYNKTDCRVVYKDCFAKDNSIFFV